MFYLHFKDKTIIPCHDLKSAYKCFMSNSRFFVHKLLEDYSDATVYKDNKKIYSWTYCKELDPEELDTYNDFYDSDLDLEPIVFVASPYYFFSTEVKNEYF